VSLAAGDGRILRDGEEARHGHESTVSVRARLSFGWRSRTGCAARADTGSLSQQCMTWLGRHSGGPLLVELGPRSWGLCLAWVAVFMGVCGAHAQSLPRVHLTWRAPAAYGCSTQSALERGVEALLERSVFTGALDQADAEVVGDLQSHDGRWVAQFELSRAGTALGRREIVGDGECAALERALIVVLATLVDGPVSPPKPQPLAADESRLTLGAAADLAYGTLPGTAFGAAVQAAWQPARAWPALALGLSRWWPREVVNARGLGGRFWAARAQVSLCPTLWETDSVRLGACAGAAFGVMQGRGLGLRPAGTPSRLLAQLPIDAVLTIHVFGRWALRASLGLSIALQRPAFYLTGEDGFRDLVHRVDLLSAQAEIGFILDVL
jgi:hypothetical protein